MLHRSAKPAIHIATAKKYNKIGCVSASKNLKRKNITAKAEVKGNPLNKSVNPCIPAPRL
jgi:hypothetical protein